MSSTTQVDKLVRDRLVEVHPELKERTRKVVDEKEYLTMLFHKMNEELLELSQATTEDEVLEEMGDVHEVWQTLMTMLTNRETDEECMVLHEKFREICKKKAETYGGFFEGLVLIRSDA